MVIGCFQWINLISGCWVGGGKGDFSILLRIRKITQNLEEEGGGGEGERRCTKL